MKQRVLEFKIELFAKTGFAYPEEWKDNDLYRRQMLYMKGRMERG
jgi:hypothetical protein